MSNYMNHVDFMPLGHDCAPAAALRSLGFRNFALPFDWVISNLHAVRQCLSDDFAKYHTELRFIQGNTQLADAYGFRFQHDYPFTDMHDERGAVGEGHYGVTHGRVIAADYTVHYNMVKEKYDRRVARFRALLAHEAEVPLIILCRYNTYDAHVLYSIICEKCKPGRNVWMVNWRFRAKFEELRRPPPVNDMIVHINPQETGIWNDTDVWKRAIEKIINQEYSMDKMDQ